MEPFKWLFIGLIVVCLIVCMAVYVPQTNSEWLLNKDNGHNSNLPYPNVKVSAMFKNSSDPVDDYYRFPCTRQLERNNDGTCVRTICWDKACGNILNKCTLLNIRMIKNAPICTYDPKVDIIAKTIRSQGGWEKHLLRNMMGVLRANPDMVLVDIGCNIGQYTLMAAWLSRRVICLDANYENLRMVQKSLSVSNLTEHVTLIWNALSNKMGETTLKIVKNNRGASRLEEVKDGPFKISRRIRTQIITLDQLLPLVKGKPVFMKVDIEGYELNALKGGTEFLRSADIRYIQMEIWPGVARQSITKLLFEYGFSPFKDIAGKQRLDKGNAWVSTQWDVYYIQPKHLYL